MIEKFNDPESLFRKAIIDATAATNAEIHADCDRIYALGRRHGRLEGHAFCIFLLGCGFGIGLLIHWWWG